MRISDWSSDVCSSDLRRRKGDVDRDRDRATVHEGREAPVREHPWPQPALDELPGDEGQEQDRNDAQHRFAMDITRVACEQREEQRRERDDAEVEIGRASCRERVSQYV